MQHTLNNSETKLAAVIKRLTHQDILHVANIITYALTETMTFKQAYYDLCPPITSKFLNDAYSHGQVQSDVEDITDKQSLIKMLFVCSMRLVSLTTPDLIEVSSKYSAYEIGWFYIPHVEADHVVSYCIYNPENIQTGTCFKYRDRPDLDSVNLTEGIDYETMVTTVLIAQLNCGCRVSL